MYEGFIVQRTTYPGGPPAFFADGRQPTVIAMSSIYVFQTMVGDSVLVRGSTAAL